MDSNDTNNKGTPVTQLRLDRFDNYEQNCDQTTDHTHGQQLKAHDRILKTMKKQASDRFDNYGQNFNNATSEQKLQTDFTME